MYPSMIMIYVYAGYSRRHTGYLRRYSSHVSLDRGYLRMYNNHDSIFLSGSALFSAIFTERPI